MAKFVSKARAVRSSARIATRSGSKPKPEITNGPKIKEEALESRRKRPTEILESRPVKKIKSEKSKYLTDSKAELSAIPHPEALPSTSRKRTTGTVAAADLQARKLKSYAAHANQSPFPDFPRPTPAECKLAHRILASLHGARRRPAKVVASATRAGCGDSPSVLDALVRTILSQNTSDTNSSRAKRSMDAAYGRSDKWDAIVEGGRERLAEAIKCGGLSEVKSKVILGILEQVRERYGVYSLDHLHEASSDEAMRELLSFQGVGPKTASCVLLFCLGRESFAVDTHVWRITGMLGWRPAKATRDETHLHLEKRIPDEDKYALHVLLVTHGKRCAECRAGGKSAGKCELRKAFRKGVMEGQVGGEVKAEIEDRVKDERKDDLRLEAVDDMKLKVEE